MNISRPWLRSVCSIVLDGLEDGWRGEDDLSSLSLNLTTLAPRWEGYHHVTAEYVRPKIYLILIINMKDLL